MQRRPSGRPRPRGRPTTRSVALAGWLVAAWSAPGCQPEGAGTPEPEAPPHIVLVVLDTLRPDHLGFHGYPRETAPFLARLARSGTLFPNAVSTSSWTAPATASLLTALYPTGHGVLTGMMARSRLSEGEEETLELQRFPETLETWAEILQGHGYRTFGVASNYNIGAEMGFDRGFDRFIRLANVPLGDKQKVGQRTRQGRKRRAPSDSAATHVSADAGAALAQLEQWREEILGAERLFLYLHLNDVHRPYVIRDAWHRSGDRRVVQSAYDSEIGHMDHALDRIWRRLELDEDTIVVVVSDHGEAFGEHGYQGHASGLDAEVQRVLFLVHSPGRGVRKAIRAETASLIDVLPTVLELAGLPAPSVSAGVSLAPIVTSGPDEEQVTTALADRAVFGHKETFREELPDLWSIQQGRFKAKLTGGRWSLFDVESDPGETLDLARSQPEALKLLQDELDRFVAHGAVAPPDTISVPLGSEQIDILRSLGYTD